MKGSRQLQGQVGFLASNSDSLQSQLGSTASSTAVVRVSEGDLNKHWVLTDGTSLNEWLHQHKMPLMPEFGVANFRQLTSTGRPVVLLAWDKDNASPRLVFTPVEWMMLIYNLPALRNWFSHLPRCSRMLLYSHTSTPSAG